ncbi:hypothetical protein EV715DRAFT_259979 [Schizophyllum commune]
MNNRPCGPAHITHLCRLYRHPALFFLGLSACLFLRLLRASTDSLLSTRLTATPIKNTVIQCSKSTVLELSFCCLSARSNANPRPCVAK